MSEEMTNRDRARVLMERARALLILRESVRCADAVSMCNQMADTIAELLDKFESLEWLCENMMTSINVLGERADAAEARLRELASAEPVAWTDSKGAIVGFTSADWHNIPLIRRPEMPS